MSIPEAGRVSLDSDVQSLHHGCSLFLLSSVNGDLMLETSFLFVCAFSVTIVIKHLKLDNKSLKKPKEAHGFRVVLDQVSLDCRTL